MKTRTVRLDTDTEAILADIRRATGWSTSAALKQGLRALKDDLGREGARKPYDLYEQLDLGPGGYASAPSSEVKDAVKRAIRRKHGR